MSPLFSGMMVADTRTFPIPVLVSTPNSLRSIRNARPPARARGIDEDAMQAGSFDVQRLKYLARS